MVKDFNIFIAIFIYFLKLKSLHREGLQRKAPLALHMCSVICTYNQNTI